MAGSTRTLVFLILAVCPGLHIAAQRPVAPDAGCVQQKSDYVCNWSSFQLTLDRAHTIAIQTDRLDRVAATQLRSLVQQLGKTPVPAGQPADLTFALAPIPSNGVDFGPGDHDLARLRITAPSTSAPNGTLLWAETYRGQGDRPWPAQVHMLLTQFQERFHGRR